MTPDQHAAAAQAAGEHAWLALAGAVAHVALLAYAAYFVAAVVALLIAEAVWQHRHPLIPSTTTPRRKERA